MRATWARGVEWWRQHGHNWDTAWFSWTLFAVAQSINTLVPDFLPGYYTSPFWWYLLAIYAWAVWYALSTLMEAFRSVRDFRRARALPSGMLILLALFTIVGAPLKWLWFN